MLPLIKEFQVNQNVNIGSEVVIVNDIRNAFDASGKNVENKVTVNGENKVVLHFYNTNLKMKIDGSTAKTFSQNFLIPYLKDAIHHSAKEIGNFNAEVASKFKSTQKINVPKLKKFSCEICEYADSSKTQVVQTPPK